MEENGIERTDKASFLHPTPKDPAGPKYPALSIPLNTKLGKNPLALGHGTAWDHYKMENFLHPTPKYPAAPKYPALSIPLNAQLGEILWLWDMGQHGTTIKWKTFSILPQNTQWPQNTQLCRYHKTPRIPSSVDTTKYQVWSLFVDIPWLRDMTAWDHYKKTTFSILSCPKTPSCPRIPSSVDTTKHPVWSLFVDIPWLWNMTTWDHYKMENVLQLAPKYTTVPKYQFLSIPQNTKLGIFLSTSLGFWDMGQHGTTIKWKTISIPPKKYPAAPNYPAPSIPVFLSTSLGFWDMGQHGTNGTLPENKFWSLCRHPLALGRPGLKKNVVSLGQ